MNAKGDTLIRFECPKCAATLRALSAQSGRRLACPRCGAMNSVPSAEHGELANDEPAEGAIADVPVVCRLCATRMHATSSQLGEYLQCPDCGVLTEVKEPPKPRAAGASVAPPAGDRDEYRLRDDALLLNSADKPHYFVYYCKLCSTQLRATAEQSGETIRCPDCNLELTVPAPPVHGEAKPLRDAGPELPLVAACEVAPVELMEHHKLRMVDGAAVAPLGLRRDYGLADDPLPPAHPFATRVFSFLFDQGTFAKWLALGLTLAAMCLVLVKAIGMSQLGFEERGTAFVMFMPSCLFLVVWSCIWVIYLLEIISETAAGNDSIGEWPELFPFSSWTGSFFYGANALAVAVAPAMLFTALVRVPPVWMPIALAASMYAILPPVLLSMLAANSPLSICSAEVIRRMSRNKRTCLLFYAATFVVYAVAVGSGYLLSLIPMAWPLFLVGVVFVMASFLVARLIGRLGWVLGRSPEEDDKMEGGAVGHALRSEKL